MTNVMMPRARTTTLVLGLGLMLGATTLSTTAEAQPATAVRDFRVVDTKALAMVEWRPWPRHYGRGPSPNVMPTGGPQQPELRIRRFGDSRVQITLQPQWRGFVHGHVYASDQLPILPGSVGGTFDRCGSDGRVRPHDWYGVQPRSDDAIDFVQGAAWFNGFGCTSHSLARRTAIAKPILNGGVYAFRSVCKTCTEDEREQLHVIRTTVAEDVKLKRKAPPVGRPLNAFVYEHQHVSIAPGTANRMVFTMLQKRDEFFRLDTLQAVVEVQRGAAGGEPSVVAYLREVPE